MSTIPSWLTTDEAKIKQQQCGFNRLPEKKPPTDLQIIVSQLKSPLVYILLVAAIITFFLDDYEDTTIIMVSVVLNTVLWWYQESKAWKALQALKDMLQPTIEVIRDGKKVLIKTQDIVPGDCMVCKAGSKIPADGTIIESKKLTVSEAMLTGESLPIEKKNTDSVFMWTVVLSGSAYILVEQIGAETELWKIALSLQWGETITPLQKQLSVFSKQLTWLVVWVVLVVFLVGVLRQQWIVEIFTTAVALAVWAIPEWLLVALTVVLTIGMQRILQRKGLVKNLVSAETLGGVTVICSDKTGTLTHGTMEVVELVGDEKEIFSHIVHSNSDDNAVSQALRMWSEDVAKKYTSSQMSTIIDVLPFSSEHKYTASLVEAEHDHVVLVTGAPEYLLEWSIVSPERKQLIEQQIISYTEAGYRLVACAQKRCSSFVHELHHEDIITWMMEWKWMICLADPIREDVKDALRRTHGAGIKLIVITGDYPGTARAIMQKLGVVVAEEMIMTGDRLSQMSDDELDRWLEQDGRVKLFARTKPDQKMRIVQALKDDGEVVAMMGDGVNDAPALKKADIGIVVWEATDVAKESADLVLLDSSFSTIVDAVEEGRGMFDNIRKIVLYLLCDAFEEILVIVWCMLIWSPLPVTASQILWINLVSDWFPNIALTVDPKRKWLMNLPPRSPQEPIVDNRVKKLIVVVSLTGAILCFLVFSYVWHQTGDLWLARSVAFVTLWINSLVYVFSVKTLHHPFWKENVFNNKWLLIAVWLWLLMQWLPFLFPWLWDFLDVQWIGGWWWYALWASVIMFIVIELYKLIVKKH